MTSIIILSYNTKEYTRMCIQSIRKYTEPGSYEIIVVDNASTDGSLNWLLAQPDIQLLANEENLGFPKGCNQGLEIAKGDDLLLLNSDTIVTPRWLEQLLIALHSSADIGAVGCMTNESCNRQRLDVPYGTDLSAMLVFAEEYNHSTPSKWHKTLSVTGFCFLFPRKVYEEVGSLDERFTPGNYEDNDYSLRIRKNGRKLLICEDTFIHHFGSKSFLKAQTLDSLLLERNRQKFLKKWGLSTNYATIHPWLEKLRIPSAAPHILLIQKGACMDAYLLQKLYPSSKITLILDTPGDVEAISPDFPARYCPELPHATDLLAEKTYDCIIYFEPVDHIPTPTAFLNSLATHLAPGGGLLYVSSDRIYQYPSIPPGGFE